MGFSVVPASYVYLRRGGRVLLQQRQNTGYMDGCWTAGAAGHVDPGETAAQAAARELAEELGVMVRPDELQPSSVMQRTDGTDKPREQRVDWFFVTDSWSGDPRILEPAKCAALGWFALDHLPRSVPGYERSALTWLRDHDELGLLSEGFPPDRDLRALDRGQPACGRDRSEGAGPGLSAGGRAGRPAARPPAPR